MSTAEPIEDDAVALRVGGKTYFGWTEVSIEGGIEDQVRKFQVKVAGVYATEAGAIVADDDVQVFVGEDLLVTGVVDSVIVGGDASSTKVTISGRSKTREVVDCSTPLTPISGKRLGDLVKDLLAPYSVGFVDEAGVSAERVGVHKTNAGEKIFDTLDKLGRESGFLVTDDEAGNVVFTRAGARGRATDRIARGTVGFLGGEAAWDCSQRYSAYQVMGQSFTDEEVDPAILTHAQDVGVRRHRLLIVAPEKGMSIAAARKRAAWEAVTRAAKSLSGAYSLRGWRQSDRSLWQANTLVEVVDARAKLLGVELLIKHIAYKIDAENGRTLAVDLAPAAGFTPEPSAAVNAGVGGVGESDELESTDPEGDEE